MQDKIDLTICGILKNRKVELIGTEYGRMMVSRGKGVGEMGEMLVKGYKPSVVR